VDAARPESETVRRLEQLAATAAAPAAMRELRLTLRDWSENDARLDWIGEELKPLSRRLAEAGAIGLRALDYLEHGDTAPEGWTSEQLRALAEMEKLCAEVVLAAVRPVRMLVEKAAGIANYTKGVKR
jgi:hypothetical protein